MTAFLNGWGFTVAALVLISVVFAVGFFSLRRELAYVRLLTDYLGTELAGAGDEPAKPAPGASLALQTIRDEATSVISARDPAWAAKQVRGWMMRAHRLEPALAFWVDFLRQLGLLFTVVGLGLSLSLGDAGVSELLEPLGLAVWTTVAGLAYSVWLSGQFTMKMGVWADTAEKNIEAWNARRVSREDA